jgi:predicted Rossmann-fold nucleotide-binding protein
MDVQEGGLVIRLLIAGSRSERKRSLVIDELNRFAEEHDWMIDLVITGGAEGVDALAKDWAETHKIPTCTFHPNWRHHGKKAGPLRNESMVRLGQPTHAIAFPGGPGTADVRRRLERAGIEVTHLPASKGPSLLF